MELEIIKTKDTLSVEEALDVKGGVNSTGEESTPCTCNCWIGNTNTQPLKPKPDPIKK